jgi:tRNA A-37 threonylcarbamoyl transferase component Bud32
MIAKRARTGAVAGFEPVLAALAAGAEEYFGDGGATIHALERHERPFSALLRVRVRALGADTYAFIKTFKPRRSGPEELAQLRRFVEREYRATRKLHEAFTGKPGLNALRPLALLPEHLTIVTEQVQGRTLDQVLRQSLWGAGPRAAAVSAAERVGAWVRTYQEVTAVQGNLSLDERREYLDIRLVKLADSMLTAGDRALALRVFDQLAARVSLPAPPLVAIHADLTPTNIIVGTDGRVTILDFAMAKSGARHHDVSHLFFHFDRLSWRRLMPDHVADVQQALLRSFDPAGSAADPLFALMLLQHAVCHIAQLAERDVGSLRPAYRGFVRRRWHQFLHSSVLKGEVAA